MSNERLAPVQAVRHLRPDVWESVNRRLVAKAIAEFSHELLIAPQLLERDEAWGSYVLASDGGDVEYRFRARVLSLEHWWVDRASLRKLSDGREQPIDVLRFILELRERLTIPAALLPDYLQELAATAYGAAERYSRPGPPAAELARADFQQLETGMLEGHPSFIANNGRIGFSALDQQLYAPELAVPTALIWLAAQRQHAEISCVQDLTYPGLLHEELGEAALAAFARTLEQRGLDPAAYVYLPVHPWQWQNRIAQLFAFELASRALVYLGPGEELYLAQQSIRTFYNVSQPGRRYVKTALSILNMGFTRGVPASIVASGAAVNDWVAALVQQDAYLQRQGFSVLREVAFVAWRHRHYEAASARRSDARKELLGALWRESPLAGLKDGQRLMTMAALLHIDRQGKSLLTALIESCGLGIDGWLRRYLQAYLAPLVHCFYAHHLTFTPHCENVILVLEDGAVARVILKDLAEDIGVLNPEVELPTAVRRLALRVPEEVMTLVIFTDVFDGVFRFLAQILEEHADYPEWKFWRLVAECIQQYEREQPCYAEKFQHHDLFASVFIRNCLNRLQLDNHQMMVDLNAPEPVDSLKFVGTLPNPLAAFRPFGRASRSSQGAS